MAALLVAPGGASADILTPSVWIEGTPSTIDTNDALWMDVSLQLTPPPPSTWISNTVYYGNPNNPYGIGGEAVNLYTGYGQITGVWGTLNLGDGQAPISVIYPYASGYLFQERVPITYTQAGNWVAIFNGYATVQLGAETEWWRYNPDGSWTLEETIPGPNEWISPTNPPMYTSPAFGTGLDVQVVAPAPTAVPEPASIIAWAGIGAMGVIASVWRRRRAKA
jgi:hypothetical protein